MNSKRITEVFFSPNGTTQQVVQTIGRNFSFEVESCDLLRTPLQEDKRIPKDGLTIVGMPVYAGRIPGLCREWLEHLKGEGGPAVAVAVYGNRDYDDALLELTDFLEENGFTVIGAGAFIAQHSIFPKVGAGRPDQADKEAMALFAEKCAENLARLEAGEKKKLVVKGNPEYRKPGAVPLKPSADKSCTRCGACAALCPTQSIPKDDPRQTNKETCISCGACIHNCPAGARAFRGPMYTIAEKKFCKKNATYRKPELFY